MGKNYVDWPGWTLAREIHAAGYESRLLSGLIATYHRGGPNLAYRQEPDETPEQYWKRVHRAAVPQRPVQMRCITCGLTWQADTAPPGQCPACKSLNVGQEAP